MTAYLVILITLLQIADAITTTVILNRGGREKNPILAKLFDAVGYPAGLLFVKGATIVLISWFGPQLPVAVLALITAGYLYVVSHNILQMLKQQSS